MWKTLLKIPRERIDFERRVLFHKISFHHQWNEMISTQITFFTPAIVNVQIREKTFSLGLSHFANWERSWSVYLPK